MYHQAEHPIRHPCPLEGHSMNDTFIDLARSLENPSLRTVTVRIHGDSDGTSKERIINVPQENGGGVFHVKSSRNVFGTLDVSIYFA